MSQPPPIIPVLPWALARRRRQAEWMDDPGLCPVLHAEALRGLERLNRMGGAAGMLAGQLAALQRRLGRPITVVDAACGGGDVAAALARQLGASICLYGVDASPVAISQATTRRIPGAQFVVGDLFGPWPDALPPAPDAIICSLFLHHLDGRAAVALLRRWAARRPALLLVSDLRRAWIDWWMVWVAARLVTRSPVVRRDSALSVQGAFTRGELLAMAGEAGLAGVRVRHGFPCRWLLEWEGR